ncbi:TonB-dependent receptor [Ferruginibacter lapsinanis]|uniref:TonB-dependent receptor plug domain-containing protein n=1 Tax=Ferruginibacter lapsinanis TaxID=563172 RepID=UPI001E64A45C|nr:TonB-dependent receptor [Ferruginibacter lapsinanis]UEG51035.1 TonB-dependent receptor [Ferruginibacter lapsinanis]
MKKNFFIVAAVLISSQLYAQDSTRSLNEVVITATKSTIKQSQTGKVITVIGRNVLDRSMGKDLAQLLTEQAGIVVNGATSNSGKDKSLYLRGAQNNNTVILINGIPLADASGVTGAFDPRLIPIEQIERIEIVKGAQSTLYGSNAVAGVINIITKKGADKVARVYGTVAAGSFNTFSTNVGVSGTIENSSYDIGFIHRQTEGISEAKDTAGDKNFDKDGFNQNGVYLNFDAGITKNFHFKPYFRYQYFNGGYDEDAFTDGANTYISSVLSVGSIFQGNFKKGTITAQYAHDETSRLYQSTNGNSPYDGRTHTAEVYATYELSDHLGALAGFDYRILQSLDDKATPKRPKINIASPYVSLYIKNISGFNVELGGRYNKHSKYGDNFSYSINPSYLINDNIKIFANVASAFRAPSLGELYGQYGSNPDLKPETSQTYEGGVQASFKDFDVRGTYFSRKIKNVITTDAFYNYVNLNKQDDHGVEIEATIKVDKKIQAKLFYAFVDGEVTTTKGGKDTTYFNLVKRPKHSIGATITYQITPRLFVSTNMYNYGKRTDNYFDMMTYTSSVVELKSYFLWNAYASFDILPKKLKLFVDAKNLLNKDYYEVYGYASQGFNITGGISFRF